MAAINNTLLRPVVIHEAIPGKLNQLVKVTLLPGVNFAIDESAWELCRNHPQVKEFLTNGTLIELRTEPTAPHMPSEERPEGVPVLPVTAQAVEVPYIPQTIEEALGKK
jgi:hypothetical protein